MRSIGLIRAFFGLWWTAGGVIVFLSARTLWRAASEPGLSHRPHVMLLAGVEAIAALLFLIPRTLRLGVTGLLLTFATAFVAHLVQGQFPAELLTYAAAVSFVGVHGPVPLRGLAASSSPGA
jgi:hypothetical protein